MDVQIALGADICMAFDECTEYPATRPRAEESLRLTMAWASRSLDHFRAHRHEVPWHDELPGRTQNLFGIVQGGMYTDLRRQCAERLVEMGAKLDTLVGDLAQLAKRKDLEAA